MTICIATDGYPPQVGGIATFNEHLVRLMTGAGHKVIVLYIDYNSAEPDLVVREGLLTKVQLRASFARYYQEWKPFFRPGGFDAPNWIATGMAMRDWLIQHGQEENIDVIEASDYGGCAAFLLDPALPPVVLTGHGSLLQYSRYNFATNDDHYKIVTQLEAVSFRHADAVIAHSPLNKTDLEQLFNRSIHQCLIPYTSNGHAQPKKTGEHMVVIGGLQPIKGVYDVAEAMKILQEKNAPLTLQWIGVDTWLAPGQQAMSPYLARTYPGVWQQHLQWLGPLPYEKTRAYMADAWLVVVPAFFETFNYVALEAAEMQKPILVTTRTGAEFIFTHGMDAWKVPANDPAALANAILYLRNNPHVCQSMGSNAAKTISSVFTPQRIVEERMAVYQEVIGQRKKGNLPDFPTLDFLKNYRQPFRKWYFGARSFAKKLIGRQVC